ncbi:MAG: hypothetical protein DKM23_07415 [Candidatus Melainabacteria bacterium]|nr:MAG: hypothetical protein DKM23_07415 [Candidatus Melainabacteria bacterium]
MTLQRINAIERQFASLSQQTMLTVDAPKTDADFQKILDKKVEDVKSGHTKGERVPNSEIDNLIEQYSAKNGLDKDFVKSVVRHESGFNVNATSKCGAMGLMQLMPATAQGLGVTNAYDAEQNIAGGTKYLKGLMDRFDNNKELALAAYNAGPNAVKKYGGVPPYKETQNYVKNIMKTYDNYKGGSN